MTTPERDLLALLDQIEGTLDAIEAEREKKRDEKPKGGPQPLPPVKVAGLRSFRTAWTDYSHAVAAYLAFEETELAGVTAKAPRRRQETVARAMAEHARVRSLGGAVRREASLADANKLIGDVLDRIEAHIREQELLLTARSDASDPAPVDHRTADDVMHNLRQSLKTLPPEEPKPPPGLWGKLKRSFGG